MAEARTRFMFVDHHRVGPECAMPGTVWDFDGKSCAYLNDPAPAEVQTAEPLRQDAS